jgi:hypothetical protein
MRSLSIALTAGVFAMAVCGCGDASRNTSSSAPQKSTSAATSPGEPADYTKPDKDRDNDPSAPYDDTSNNSVLDYGHAASARDKRAVAALIKRYYAVAGTEDGATACSMIPSKLASSVVEDYGRGSAGPSYMRSGTTCPATMVLLFKHFKSQLKTEIPQLKIARVRLVGHRGLAVLSFGTMPERQIHVAREGGTWKVQELLDDELP